MAINVGMRGCYEVYEETANRECFEIDGFVCNIDTHNLSCFIGCIVYDAIEVMWL